MEDITFLPNLFKVQRIKLNTLKQLKVIVLCFGSVRTIMHSYLIVANCQNLKSSCNTNKKHL